MVVRSGELQSAPFNENLFETCFVSEIFKRIAFVHKQYQKNLVEKKAYLFYGDSGSGKTYLCQEYVKRHKPVRSEEKITIPVLYHSFKHTNKGVKELLKVLILALGGNPPNTRADISEIEFQFFTLVDDLEVELIILDEVQHLLPKRDGPLAQTIIKYFCGLLDDSRMKCSIVFVGSEAAHRLMTFGQTQCDMIDDEQLSRRMLRPTKIKKIFPRTREWINCVNWFLRKVGLPNATEQNKLLLDKVYMAYSERGMSTLRDLFMQENIRQTADLVGIEQELAENFESFCKGNINPFDGTLADDDDIAAHVAHLRDIMREEDAKLKNAIKASL